ncbi:MAG: NAD-dependent epimerase/dehydratase family protein [Clostridiales bacterium]|nr:NAD-dependent epimerase/dehydratase family protein [Clostridiales bacterium]
MFQGKTLLITGGTGSIGREVLAYFWETDLKEIRIFSRDEEKQYQLKLAYGNERLRCYLGDIRDEASLRSAMRGVDYVFHAAALKHVPSSEIFPSEVVKTNILGTENVLNTAIEAGVKKVICLSTDKAVYPSSAMGISKAMMEKIACAKAAEQTETVICCTRFGNILGSRGSVIPTWAEQTRLGKKITLTEPSMTRFIMTKKEAAELIYYAFEKAQSGDILIKKAAACRVDTLVKAVLRAYGKNMDDVIITGKRPGERMSEYLLTHEEAEFAQDMGSFLIIPMKKIEKTQLTAKNSSESELMGEDELFSLLLENNIL